MEALDVETSIAAGEQALQVLIKFAREHAGKLEVHEAEKGIFKRLLPMGLAAMKLSCAECGTGDVGPAITRADGRLLTRAKPLRGRDDFSLFGTFAVAWTWYRTAGEPGIFPLDAPVNLPERCYAYVLQEWMTVFEVEHPCKASAGFFAQLVDLDVAESVLMEVAKEAPEDYEGFSAQRPVPPEEPEGELLVVSFDGKGVPMIKAEAVQLTAKLGTGEKRQQKKAALVGVSSTVDAKRRSPEALAALLVDPEAARARRQREDTRDEAPRAQPIRRLASLVRTKQAVMECIKPTRSAGIPSTANPWSSCSMAPSACGAWRPSSSMRGGAGRVCWTSCPSSVPSGALRTPCSGKERRRANAGSRRSWRKFCVAGSATSSADCDRS
jgi:hypothetical protein